MTQSITEAEKRVCNPAAVVQTLRDWNANLQSGWGDFRERHEEPVRRMFEYFFLVSAALFRARIMQYWHLVMTRQGDAQPACRVSCVDCESRLAESVPMHAEACR
jgi:hypothetical protein